MTWKTLNLSREIPIGIFHWEQRIIGEGWCTECRGRLKWENSCKMNYSKKNEKST